MQNHLGISSKNLLLTRNVPNWNKVVIWTCPDLPRPVQEDKSLSAKQVFAFIFSEITPFHFYWKIYLVFGKSHVLLSKFIIFYKIIGFTKQIYHFSSPYRKTTFIISLYRFYAFYIFISNFMIFHQN